MLLSSPSIPIIGYHLLFLLTVLGIQIGYRRNATDFFLKEEELQVSINISSDDFAETGLR